MTHILYRTIRLTVVQSNLCHCQGFSMTDFTSDVYLFYFFLLFGLFAEFSRQISQGDGSQAHQVLWGMCRALSNTKFLS